MTAAFSAADVAIIATGTAACVTDLRSRRIPNVLTFGASAAAVLFGAVSGGLAGAGWSLAGWAVGCAVFMPWFLLGGMGAGDVKLLAALGAWAGPSAAVWMALYAGIAGGVFAVVVSLMRGYFAEMVRNLWSLLMFWRIAGIQPHPEIALNAGRGPRLPYAVPIAVGAAAVLWLK
jgi:prepilin peptidase CpaA